jgi:hypothetical protein
LIVSSHRIADPVFKLPPRLNLSKERGLVFLIGCANAGGIGSETQLRVMGLRRYISL